MDFRKWLEGIAWWEWGEPNINYLLKWRQMPCRQQWQLCQESLSALYYPSSTRTVVGAQKAHKSLSNPYGWASISWVRKKGGFKSDLRPIYHTLFSLRCSLLLSVNNKECCPATQHPHAIASPWGGANTHTQTVMRAHLLRYQKDSNSNSSDTNITNTESRWKRMLTSRRRVKSFKIPSTYIQH